MLKVSDIANFMDGWSPEDLAESWDNVGLQVGNSNSRVEKLLISLDLDEEVIARAINIGANMIVTHHPFIFSTIKSVTNLDYTGRLIMMLIQENISIYSSHTNLDQVELGVSYQLSEILGIEDSQILSPRQENNKLGYGRIGRIEKISVEEYIPIVKEKLEVDRLTVYGDTNKVIGKVAVLGGSGSGFIGDAYNNGADLYITGDIKYHDGQEADRLGMTIIDPGHFHTEKMILNEIKRKISNKFTNLAIEVYEKPSPIYKIY